jgi:hypothetical protein
MVRTVILFVALALPQYLAAQTTAELKAKLPQVSGWTVDQNIETFDANNLYERINGAAEGYLLFDFRELSVFVYNQSKGGAEAPYITIQIYRHATPADAFGVYAAERPSETNFVNIGAEGYQEGTMLNFLVDSLYVKMESPSSSGEVAETIGQIAGKLAQSINSKAQMPVALQSFPAENKVAHSEQYISKSFLGHEFLQHAFTSEYQVSGKKYSVFIIDAGTPDAAKNMLDSYYRFTGQATPLREGKLTVEDRYNGNIRCQWKGRHVWGILNDSNAPVKVDGILKFIEGKL